MLFFVLPFVTTSLDRAIPASPLSTQTTNSPSTSIPLIITRISLFILAVSLLATGLASTIPSLVIATSLQTLAVGIPGALRTLTAAIIPSPSQLGSVFSGLAVAETLSIMVAFPSCAALFSFGLRMHESGHGIGWTGLPFYATAFVAAFVALGMLKVRL